MVQLAYQLRFSLESNQLDDFGRILHEGWLMKKSLTSGISTGVVDEMYDRAFVPEPWAVSCWVPEVRALSFSIVRRRGRMLLGHG